MPPAQIPALQDNQDVCVGSGPAGSDTYAFVDSADSLTSYGGASESHEGNKLAEYYWYIHVRVLSVREECRTHTCAMAISQNPHFVVL